MKDIKLAIQALVNNAMPIKFKNSDMIASYCVGKYDLLELIAEYNIAFVEPEDIQLTLEDKPLMELRIEDKNVKVLTY